MDNAFVHIVSYNSRIEADLKANLLRSQGIEVFIHGDDAGGMLPQLSALHGIQLLVPREDAERALDILGG